ncbi:MAG TPA: CHASE2 domain-containing protein [Enhygromyxa sp.]|nr:CHASE2 domain-containing protein [Enhygromyxa sp.]
MGKARIEPYTEGRATNPRELESLLRASLTVLAGLLVVLLLDVVGIVATLDDSLRHHYISLSEELGVSRESSELIVLVAADRETIAAWGPPPWPAERLEALLGAIEGGEPELIVELGHTRLFAESAGLEAMVAARGAKLLISDEDGRSPWSGVGLERGDLRLGPDSRAVELGARSDRLPTVPERLPVHWLTPASRLPVVPAHHVARGKIPARTFARRVVVLGVTDLQVAMPVVTPLGLLSPVEIEAHALTGLADGVVWADTPRVWSYLGCALLACALLWSFVRLRVGAVVLLATGSVATLLLVDFVLYERGLLRLGSGHALLTVVALAASHWSSESLSTWLGLRRLRTRVLEETARSGAAEREREIDDVGFWDDLAAIGAEYAQERIGAAAASTVLERERDGFALTVRASAKLDREGHGSIAAYEHLDVRRAPFRGAWLTARASWTTELLPRSEGDPQRTLIVPLIDEGELFGLWLLHPSPLAELEREDVVTFERLGRQMAGALMRRRERQSLRGQSSRAGLREHMQTIVGGLRLLRDEHRWALELLEQLPVRAMIATVWGELEFVDPRLRSELARRYPGLFSDDMPEQNLRTVLARLTGKSFEETHRLLRNVVASGVEIELDAAPGIDDPGDDVWVLSRIHSKRGVDLPGFKPGVDEHILLLARSSAPAQTIKTRSGAFLRVLGRS